MDTAFAAAVLAAGAVVTPTLARTVGVDRKKVYEVLCRTGVRLVPEEERSELGRKLAEAGLYDVSPDWFAGLRWALAGGFAILCLPLLLFGIDLFWLVFLAPVLYFLPGMWLNSRISKRKSQIRLSLADFSVLFSTALSAGADIVLALEEAAGCVGGPLAEEVDRALREYRTGQGMVDVLVSMADRCNVDEFRSLVRVVVQSYRYGAPLAESMRAHAEQMRSVKRFEVMEAAGKLTVSMVIPVLVFILVPSMLVLFYPAAVQLMSAFGM